MTIIILIVCSFLYAMVFVLNDHLAKKEGLGFAPPFLASMAMFLLFIVPIIMMGVEFVRYIAYVVIVNLFGVLIYLFLKKK